ncbi:MAG: nucA 1 [Flavipsychrobacter sp.]|nr:nucA 1 [Flavipsychrobacter sp.]
MQKRVILSWLLLFGLALNGFAQKTVLIKHKWYTITYSTDQCSPIMGYYVQTQAHAKARTKIDRGDFKVDPMTPKMCDISYSKEYAEYNKQYPQDLQRRMDKGHISPYEAFTFAEDAAKESMYYDNVCPQISHVNEQEWRQVEAEVQDRSATYGDVKVWTGVLISKSHPRMMGHIGIPDYYWKVISYKKSGKTQREAWLSHNVPENLDTKAAQAVSTFDRVVKVIHQYYPKFTPDF